MNERAVEIDRWSLVAMIWAAIGYPFGAINKDGIPGMEAPFFLQNN